MEAEQKRFKKYVGLSGGANSYK